MVHGIHQYDTFFVGWIWFMAFHSNFACDNHFTISHLLYLLNKIANWRLMVHDTKTRCKISSKIGYQMQLIHSWSSIPKFWTIVKLHAFLYKYHLYKNQEPQIQICPKVKHHLNISLILPSNSSFWIR